MAQKGAKKPRLAEEEESAAAIEVDSDSEDDGGDDGSQEEESGLQEEESGKPGTKRTRGKGTPGTRDPEVVKNWGTSMLKFVWGFRSRSAAAGPQQARACLTATERSSATTVAPS